MSLSSNFPTVGPVLNLDFVNNQALDPRITFTRASTATYFDYAGVLQTAQNNIPRFDYNPSTLVPQGLLIEESRTNSIRNNTMVGAAAGTPGTLPTNWGLSGLGTLTQQVVGTGTVNGITYIDLRFSGTTSTTQLTIRFEPNGTGGIAAANGQTWAGSVWTAVVAGSTTNITSREYSCNVWDAGGTYVGNVIGFAYNASSTLTRSSGSGTIAIASAAFIQPQIYLTFSSGVAIDITLRIGLPQLEQGDFSTSVIPTSTVAVTRSADVASMTGTNFSSWYNAVEGTIVGSGASNLAASKVQFFATVDTNTQNYISLARFSSATGGTSRIVDTNSIQADMALGTLTTLVPFKLATAYKANDFASSTNGAAAVTDTAGTVPTINKLSIGNVNGTVQMNGYIQRIAYYNYRVSNAQLQALTGS